MMTSSAGRAFIARQEGCVLHCYLDMAGIPTCCVGHRCLDSDPWWPRVMSAMALDMASRAAALRAITFTQAQADALLENDLRVAENCVNAKVIVEIGQNQFDALVDFTFNEGTNALATSTTLRKLNAGDDLGAASALLMWIKRKDPASGTLVDDPNLLARRVAERELFLTDDADLTA